MPRHHFTPAQEQAQERIHGLLAELAALIGPHFDGQAAADPEVDPDDLAQGATLLTEWVVVSAWLDEAGEAFVVPFGSRALPDHHLAGLLHEALYRGVAP